MGRIYKRENVRSIDVRALARSLLCEDIRLTGSFLRIDG